jgi:hypothetical protein
MNVRDAVEADAGRLAALTDAPRDVMRNLVHDRTVRVAAVETEEGDEGDDEDDGGEILGFVSFDARADTVHVTQLEGDPDTFDRLLEEPIRFARSEGMAVELLVPEDETDLPDAARKAGFEEVGQGPRFEGQTTARYRLEGEAETP